MSIAIILGCLWAIGAIPTWAFGVWLGVPPLSPPLLVYTLVWPLSWLWAGITWND